MNPLVQILDAMDRNPALPVMMAVVLVVLWLVNRKARQSATSSAMRIGKAARSVLDQALLWWSKHDFFTIRDLLNGGGLLILGLSGAGKTSSSGRALMLAIVKCVMSAGLILAAKPEDAEDVIRIFRKAGRLGDLIIFGPDTPYRFNFLRYVGKGDARNVVRCIMMIGETLERGNRGGGEDGDYWKAQCERLLETAVIALQVPGEEVTALNLHKFIMSAAMSPQDIGQQGWQQKYQGKVLEAGFNAVKSPQRAHDYEMAKDYWLLEFPGMADRTRSSILTYATQILHVFNTGLAKEMIAGETNVTPDDILNKKWILVNYPPSSCGAVGSLINAGWKYLTEVAILKRKVKEGDCFCVIWSDEAHATANSFDAVSFIPQCRSRRGCLVFLSQSVSSFYAAMRGEAGHHQADALMSQFGTVIAHVCDPISAKWLGAKLGRQIQTLWSGSSSQSGDLTMYDRLYGDNRVSGSFGEHYEQVLQDQEFMIGRTGGPENGFVCDAVVVKSGMPFSTGQNWLRVEFSQKG